MYDELLTPSLENRCQGLNQNYSFGTPLYRVEMSHFETLGTRFKKNIYIKTSHCRLYRTEIKICTIKGNEAFKGKKQGMSVFTQLRELKKKNV